MHKIDDGALHVESDPLNFQIATLVNQSTKVTRLDALIISDRKGRCHGAFVLVGVPILAIWPVFGPLRVKWRVSLMIGFNDNIEDDNFTPKDLKPDDLDKYFA